MGKFIATAAVLATAAGALTLGIPAAVAAPTYIGEIRSGCESMSGFVVNPDHSLTQFGGVEGTAVQLPNLGAGLYRFETNQPGALPAYGPGMGEDESFSFARGDVQEATVLFDDGHQMTFFNDRAHSFDVPVGTADSTFHVYYKCGIGRN